jgi:hypothetical protein
MHLNGDLSDFALADILQILSLGRKTGTLLVENGSVKGRIIIEDGRITGAEAQPGGSLADALVRRGRITAPALTELRRIAAACPQWDFESLLLESGLLNEGDVQQAAVMQIGTLIAQLVEVGKGSFRLLLNETALANPRDNVKLADGLDIGEVLLQSATKNDEARRTGDLTGRMPAGTTEPTRVMAGPFDSLNRKSVAATQLPKISDPHKEAVRPPVPTNGAATNGHAAKQANGNGAAQPGELPPPRTERFYALLAELSANSVLMEISLLVMRYASEFASRGILFGVHDGELHGIGQFGVDRFVHSHQVDSLIRAIRLPLAGDALVASVARQRSPFVGSLPGTYWNAEMLDAIGGGHDGLQALAVPLLRDGQVVYVIYADNFGTSEPLIAQDELVALASVTTLALDKSLLHQRAFGAEAY